MAILPEEWCARYDALLLHGRVEEETIRLRKHHFPIVKDLAKQEFDDEKDREQASRGESIKHRADKLSSLLEKDNIPLPEVPEGAEKHPPALPGCGLCLDAPAGTTKPRGLSG